MKGKKKISAILAVLMLTVSFLIAIPIPVSAAPANAMIYLSSFAWKYPTGAVVPDPTAGYPFSQTLNYPADVAKMGALPILAVTITNTTVGGFNMSSWEVGVKWIPEVFGYPVTFSPFGAPVVPGLPATIFQNEYFTGNANYTAGTINIYHGEVSGYKMARNDSLSTTVTGFTVLCYIIPTVVGYGETYLDIASYVKIDDQGVDITPATILPGYFKFRIHEALLTPTVWTDPPYTTSNTLTVPINIKTTEPVHTWELNMSYYGLNEYGAPTTPTISCSSTANVSQGNFLLLSNRTSPHGGNTFNALVGPGWVWANGTYNVATQYADSWSGATLMVINFAVLSYGKTILNVTQFSARNTTGAEITPQPHFDLDKGLRMTYFNFEKYVSVAGVFEDTGSTNMGWSHPPKTIGTTFNMNVTIMDTSQNVHAWKSGFRFNPTVLECLSVTEGPYLSDEGGTTWNPNIVINNTSGEVYNITCTGDTGVDNSGYGILFYIEFNVTGYGRSLIEFTDKDGDVTETQLQDNAGTEIRNPGGLPSAISIFEFRAPITVLLTLASNKKESYFIGEIFTVQLTINSSENMRGWQSGFYFDTDFLDCTNVNVTFGDVFAGATYNFTKVDCVNGYVSVSQTFNAPNFVSGGVGLLANITFQIKAYGHTYLDLTDQLGEPIQTVITDPDAEVCTLTSDLVEMPWGHSGIVWILYDVDGIDGVATAFDFKKVKLAVDGWQAHPFADVDYDGAVTSFDLKKVKLKVDGWI